MTNTNAAAPTTYITYTDHYFVAGKEINEQHRSKVYKTWLQWFPSGQQTMCLVWNPRLNKCVAVRKDHTTEA